MRADVHLPDEFVDAVARRAAELVLEELRRDDAPSQAAGRWLTVEQAAAYIAAAPQRIYDLRSSGRLTDHREGGRALVDREELDALIVADRPARTPAARCHPVATPSMSPHGNGHSAQVTKSQSVGRRETR